MLDEIVRFGPTVAGLAGMVGAAYATLRQKALSTDLETHRNNLEAFRASNQELRDENHGWESKHLEAERRCSENVARLEGAVEMLRSGIVADLVESLRTALADTLHEALNQPDRRGSGT